MKNYLNKILSDDVILTIISYLKINNIKLLFYNSFFFFNFINYFSKNVIFNHIENLNFICNYNNEFLIIKNKKNSKLIKFNQKFFNFFYFIKNYNLISIIN